MGVAEASVRAFLVFLALVGLGLIIAIMARLFS